MSERRTTPYVEGMTTRRADELTDRELEVVNLVVGGMTNREIADVLGLSPRTVQAHVAAAMQRTATKSRTNWRCMPFGWG